jgi:hypothetical protein
MPLARLPVEGRMKYRDAWEWTFDHESFAPVAQLDRALPSEGRGRAFESRRVRQFLLIKITQ